MLGKNAGQKIKALRERLVDSNARSVFVNAHPKKSLVKIDLYSMSKGFISKQNHLFIYPFLFNHSFEMVPFKDFNANEINYKKTVNLFRKNEDFKNEFNQDPLGLGYPLLMLESKNKNQYQLTPLFIWDVSLTQSVVNPTLYSYKIKQSESVTLNPSIKRYLKYNSNKDHIRDYHDIKNDPLELIKAINLILEHEGENLISSSFLWKPLTPIPEKLDRIFFNKNHKLINNGVIGLFANSKEPIITDYFKLEHQPIACHFKSFTDNNKSHFSGLALDHSQQGVIRSICERKNTIVHGPPGTGKSKTITAVLNYALSKGQRCLMVSEKKTAMEVIYQNLKRLGISDYAVKITDIKKDRRSVINKARDIIEKEKKELRLLFDQQKKEMEVMIEKNKWIEARIKKVTATIELISKIKKKLNVSIIDSGDSYSDLVLRTQKDELKKLSQILKLNPDNFEFSSGEWEQISTDLNFLEQYLQDNPNPFKFFYVYINKNLLKEKKKTFFNNTINAVHDDFLEDLKLLIKDWKYTGEKFDTYQIKYFNYIKSDNIQLRNLYDRYVYLKKKILEYPLFDKTFIKQILRIEPLYQLEKILKVLELMKNYSGNFSSLIPFHNYISKRNVPFHECIVRGCEIDNFDILFHRWYMCNILKKNHITHLDFNGFEKGYFDLIEDLNKINKHFSKIGKTNAQSQQHGAIKSFEKNNTLRIEQFFSKRSTKNRMKLPLHKITKDSSDIFNQLFPIVITNPSSCSQLFPMEKGYFDFVVFDESSQLKIEDTLPALLRGKITIVSGDTQQLPPSDYFIGKEYSDDFSEKEKKMTSLLDFCKMTMFQNHYLDIHYRSNHPDLIQFSNHAFYQKRLIPLPPKKEYTAIEFKSIMGLFENRTNVDEANAILKYLSDTISSDESVGVATFNQFQQNLLLDMILKKTISDPKFKTKMDTLKNNGFFVKNIENIQGEERNIILISTTYGPNRLGKFKQLFGSLNNKKKGHKLLNVVITRAINKMVVFSSVPSKYYEDFNKYLEKKGLFGKAVFYSFISYAKSVSEKNNESQQKILNALYQSSNAIPTKTNYKKQDLMLFSEHLTKILTEKSGIKINCICEYSLGGITYEMLLNFDGGKKILIDLNGKEVNRDYQDYLYDAYRCKIAQKSGFQYYRLWLSNYYNQQLNELNNILKVGSGLKKKLS